MAGIVGTIVLSIMLPVFNMYSAPAVTAVKFLQGGCDAVKHFVYLTEDKLYYIRRAPGRSGGYYFLGFRPVAGLEGVESAMESLSEVYN